MSRRTVFPPPSRGGKPPRGGYKRWPGLSPTYGPVDTRYYRSRKARIWRGLQLTPDFRQARKFFFNSVRGPAKDQGRWIVTTAKQDDLDLPDGPDGGGGDPGGGSGNDGNWPKAGDTIRVLYAGWYWDERVSRTEWRTHVGGGYAPDGTGRWPVSSIHSITQYFYDNPLGFTHYAFRTAVYNEPSVTYGEDWPSYYEIFVGQDHVLETDDLAGVPHANDIPEGSWLDGFISLIPFEPVLFQWVPDNGEPIDIDPNSPPPPSDGGTPAAPDDWVYVFAADIAYKCTCPDFTLTESPYFKPLAPSQYQDRDWKDSKAGRPFNFPCKHCIATALDLADTVSLRYWVEWAEDDYPARENYADYERLTNAALDRDRDRIDRLNQQRRDRADADRDAAAAARDQQQDNERAQVDAARDIASALGDYKDAQMDRDPNYFRRDNDYGYSQFDTDVYQGEGAADNNGVTFDNPAPPPTKPRPEQSVEDIQRQIDWLETLKTTYEGD